MNNVEITKALAAAVVAWLNSATDEADIELSAAVESTGLVECGEYDIEGESREDGRVCLCCFDGRTIVIEADGSYSVHGL